MNKQKLLILSFVLLVTCLLFADPPQWELIGGNQYNMIVKADVTLFDQEFGNDNPGNMLAAFGPSGDNDCRAIGEWQELPDSTGFWWLTVVSNAEPNIEELISFMIYNASDDQIYHCQGEYPVIFIDNAEYGSVEDRFQLYAPPNPVAIADIYYVNEDEILNVIAENGVLANDYDPVDSILTASIVDYPMNGSLSFNINGAFTYTPDSQFNGIDSFTYIASDGTYFSDTTLVTINVNPVNDPPEITLPPSYTFDEDSVLDVDFSSDIHDIDTDLEDLYLVFSNNQYIDVSIDGFMITFTPQENWNGTENILFTVYDMADTTLFDSDSVNLIVRPVNDPPVLISEFDDLTLDEDFEPYSIDLSLYFEDIDDILVYNSVVTDDNLYTDFVGDILTLTSEPNWFGYSEVTIYAYDSDSLFVVDNFSVEVLSVNDPPVIDLPLIGFSFPMNTILNENFAPYITDVDFDEVTLTATGFAQITVDIDGFMVTFSTEENWYGQEDITFTVNDNQGRAIDSQTVPVIVFVETPTFFIFPADGFSFDEDDDLYVDFSEYKFDPALQIDSLFIEDNQNITIDISEAVVHFSAPLNWYGSEILTVNVIDQFDQLHSQPLAITVIPVNDPPVFVDMPDELVFDEDTQGVVDFSANVFDVESQPLELNILNNVNIYVEIDSFLVTFSTDNNWTGSEILTFLISEQDSRLVATDTVLVTFMPVNDPPQIDIEDEYVFQTDESLMVDFTQYITDPDPDSLTLTVEDNLNIIVDIDLFNVTFSTMDNWIGSELITFIINDNQGRAIDSDTTTVTAIEDNNEPVIDLPETLVTNEDTAIMEDFSDYISDPEDDELILTAETTVNVDIIIDGLNVTFEPHLNWFGAEYILFEVTDGEFTVADSVYFIVNPVNDPPVITGLPEEYVFEADSVYSYDFQQYISDVDEDPLSLSVNGNVNVQINIEDFMVTFTTSEWLGVETVTFSVDDGVSRATDSAQTDLVVAEDITLPFIQLPESLTLNEDTTLSRDFDDYIFNDNGQIDYLLSASGFENINVNIEQDNHIVTFIPELNWDESEVITFTISDSASGLYSSDFVLVDVIPVDDPPIIDLPPTGFFNFNEDSQSIGYNFGLNLAEEGFIFDVDDSLVTVDIQPLGSNVYVDLNDEFIAVFSAAENFNSIEGVYFSISVDDDIFTTTDSFRVFVNPVNDLPSVYLPVSFSFNEDTQSDTYDFSDYITDVDNDYYVINRVDAIENINVDISGTEVTFSAPENWNGSEYIVFSVNDLQEDGIVTDTVMVIVEPVNDDPEIVLPAELTFNEDENLVEDFTQYISDIDGDDLELSVVGNTDINVIIDFNTVTFSAADNWFGSEMMTFIVNDNQNRALASDSVMVIVDQVNDVPTLVLPDEFNFNEGESLNVDFNLYADDIDGDILLLDYSGGTNINVSISGLIVTFATADPNWFGSEEITFTVNDNQSRDTASDAVIINVLPVNDPPVISLPESFTMDEDTELEVDFEDYITDIDNNSADWTLEAPGTYPNLTILINELIVTFEPGADFNGTISGISFVVEDLEASNSDETSLIVNDINDDPFIELPDSFTFPEDGSLIENFVDYISDADEDELTLSVSGNDSITVEINELEVTFSAEENWWGTETLEFSVSDGQGRPFISDEVDVIVTSVNDAPVLDLPDSFTFDEDEDLERNFMQYVTNDLPAVVLALQVEGQENINVDIDNATFEVVFTAEPNWNGSEILTFTVYETVSGLSASDTVNVIVDPVDDAPLFIGLPEEWSITEDQQGFIPFGDYIQNFDTDDLFLSWSGNEEIILDTVGLDLTISAPGNWIGSKIVEFTITDDTDEMLSDSAIMTISFEPVNDPPYILDPIPDLILDEDFGINEEIDFSVYFADVDEDVLSYEIEYENTSLFNYEILQDHILQLQSIMNVFGETDIVVTANDNYNRATVSDTFHLTIEPVNDIPVVNLPPFIIAIKDSMETVNLGIFISDVETPDENLTMVVEQSTDSEIDSILVDGLSITVIDDSFNVAEYITVRVIDEDSGESSDITELRLIAPDPDNPIDPDNIVITLPWLDGFEFGDDVIMPVNVNYLLPGWEINGFSFDMTFIDSVLQFTGYDWENTIAGPPDETTRRDTFTWENAISGSGSVVNLVFKYVSNEYEQAVVELDDFEFNSPGGGFPAVVIDGVVNNDYPSVENPINRIDFLEDFSQSQYDLNFVFKDNSPNSELEFSVINPSQYFNVSVDNDFLIFTSVPDSSTTDVLVTVVCWDQFEYLTRHTFPVSVAPVNDPPVISVPPFVWTVERDSIVDFTEFVYDVDNEIDELSIMSIDNSTGNIDIDLLTDYPLSAQFMAPRNWTGVDNFTITVTDNMAENNLSEEDDFTITIIYVQPDDIHCYPNPMNTTDGTSFVVNTVKNLSSIEISIYDFAGREVCNNTFSARGAQEIHWLGYNDWDTGDKLARGVYFARVVGRNQSGGKALEKVVKVAIKE